MPTACVFIGEVNYINYETQGFPMHTAFNFIMHKRLSFIHERELRAVFWEMDGTPEAQPSKQTLAPPACKSGQPVRFDRERLRQPYRCGVVCQHGFGSDGQMGI